MAMVKISLDVPHEESDYYVVLPKDAKQWAEQMDASLSKVGGFELVIDSVAHGCDGVSLSFEPSGNGRGCGFPALDDRTAFGFIADRKTLKTLVLALQTAIAVAWPDDVDSD